MRCGRQWGLGFGHWWSRGWGVVEFVEGGEACVGGLEKGVGVGREVVGIQGWEGGFGRLRVLSAWS